MYRVVDLLILFHSIPLVKVWQEILFKPLCRVREGLLEDMSRDAQLTVR